MGPVVVLRAATANKPATAVIGFDPLAGAQRFDVATPLLFASLIDRLRPGSFRERLYVVEPVGLARVALDASEHTGAVRAFDARGVNVPFTRRGAELQIFVSKPDTVHVASGGKERVLDLRLPAVADATWNLAGARRGLPQGESGLPSAQDLWRWLACGAALLLAREWFLFGGFGRSRPRQEPAV